MIKFLRHITHTPSKNMVWMIGNFDGVHIGHQMLIRHAQDIAQETSSSIGLLTFEPHPRKIFKPSDPCFRIQQFSEKLLSLSHYGVDYCYAYKFDKLFSQMTAEDFCKIILHEHLSPKAIIVGHDFCFGKGRIGNTDMLMTAGKKYGFSVHIISEQLTGTGTRFSSAQLRHFIRHGEIDHISSFLGRSYILSGRVRSGRKLARILGFPTANIAPADVMYPAFGVYKVRVLNLDGKDYPAIANVGIKPTLEEDSAPMIEIHIPHFSADIYGKKLRIAFEKFIRPEKKFASLDSLKEQIKKDIENMKVK